MPLRDATHADMPRRYAAGLFAVLPCLRAFLLMLSLTRDIAADGAADAATLDAAAALRCCRFFCCRYATYAGCVAIASGLMAFHTSPITPRCQDASR